MQPFRSIYYRLIAVLALVALFYIISVVRMSGS
mgnify:CR=1 FL=1